MPGPDPRRGCQLLRLAYDMGSMPIGQRQNARVAQAAEACDAGLEFVLRHAQRHGSAQEFHDVLGEVPLESWTAIDFFPEENRIAELVEGQKPQPAMMF